MSKKPRKADESTITKPASATETTLKSLDKDVHYVDDTTFRKAADKIFAERHDLLRRLAQ